LLYEDGRMMLRSYIYEYDISNLETEDFIFCFPCCEINQTTFMKKLRVMSCFFLRSNDGEWY